MTEKKGVRLEWTVDCVTNCTGWALSCELCFGKIFDGGRIIFEEGGDVSGVIMIEISVYIRYVFTLGTDRSSEVDLYFFRYLCGRYSEGDGLQVVELLYILRSVLADLSRGGWHWSNL